jgi:maleate isomerase
MLGTARLLESSPKLAARPARWRVGLIALATDHTSERDFAAMCPVRDLAIYVNRVAFANPANEENLLTMQPLLTEAAALILPGESLDAMAYSCTAASALIGDDVVCAALQAAKPDCPVVTPTSAALQAFATLGLQQISVLTPYTQDVTQALTNYFERSGRTILNASCFGFSDDREMARIDPDEIFDAAVDTCHPKTEGLFISCTGLRAASVAQRIEDQLAKPVITSNQAMFWHTIRQAGCPLPVPGYGRLLSMH